MIPKYKTILYATDLTPNAAHAFRHAVGIARCHQARIFILHVLPEIEPAVLNYVSTVMGEDRLADMELAHKAEVQDEIRKRLHEFAKADLADRPEDVERIAGIEVHHGNPAGEILKAADRLNVDLIVLGNHGKGKLKYAFLGSVADKVLRKALRPVVVVPLQ